MEQFEMALLERLKETHSKQQAAYKDVESIIHDGYHYYLKSFLDKMTKHDQQYCNRKHFSRNLENS